MRKAVEHFLSSVRELTLGLLKISESCRRLRCANNYGQTQFGCLERTRDNVPLNLKQLRLCHLCFGVYLEVAIGILLGRRHLLKSFFVTLEDFDLVRHHNLPTEGNRKSERGERLQHSGKGRVRKLFETYDRIQV